MNNIERYNKFSSTSFSWDDRFTWKGIYGDKIISSLSIIMYNNETSNLKNLSFNNTLSFYNQMKAESVRYADWCKTKKPQLSQYELEKLVMFFLGCIGEFFFYELFNHKNQLIIADKNKAYTFYDICPRLSNEYDFGVDLTGRVSVLDKSYDCVFQVKFWNPFSEVSFIDNHIAQAVHSDAIVNDMINMSDIDNIFICWLGTKDNVSSWLSKNNLNKHIVFIDKKVLKDNIDGDSIFWQKIYQDISNI